MLKKTGLAKKTLMFTLLSFLANPNLFALSQDEQNADQRGTPLTIQGVDGELRDNVAAHLELSNEVLSLSALGFPRSNEYILRKTRSALQALGYYQPIINLQGSHDRWLLDIDPGKPTRWRDVNIVIQEAENLGFDLGVNSELLNFLEPSIKKVKALRSTILNHGKYQNLKSALQSSASQKGYLEAYFGQSEFTITKTYESADINWRFVLGPRYRISSITFSESPISRDLLNRYLTIASGEFFDSDKLINTQQRLNRTGFFSNVNIEKLVDHATKTVDVYLALIEQPKYQIKTSLGYGTDSGGRAGFEWQNRRINSAGHRYSITTEYSEISQSAAFIYRIPLSGPGSEWLGRASFQIKDDSVATSKISALESRWVVKHSDHWTNQFALAVATEEISRNQSIENYLEYLVPSWRIDYYSESDPFSAREGWHWQSIVRMSNDAMSDPKLDFVQTQQRMKWIYAVDERWRILARTTLGLTKMREQEFLSSMPTNYRFFAGGDTSVRGYDYQTLAPTNDSGELIGGQYLISQTIEVDWEFTDNWRWAWFADAGNAFNSSSKTSLNKSIGTGIRWVTPVGSIRIDFAKALDLTEEWRWHITIGPDL